MAKKFYNWVADRLLIIFWAYVGFLIVSVIGFLTGNRFAFETGLVLGVGVMLVFMIIPLFIGVLMEFQRAHRKKNPKKRRKR